MKKSIATLLVILCLFQQKARSQDKNFYIFLAFGQSNMEGAAPVRPQDTVGVDPRFRVMEALDCPNLDRKQGQWYTAVPPLCRCTTGVTLTDNFGRTLVAHLPKNVRVGIINVAVGGCKIELFDTDTYQAFSATAPDWMKKFIASYGGNPYERLVDLAKMAQHDGVIKGILLHQGESNKTDSLWPVKVKKVYGNLLRDLGLSAQNVPLLAGEVVGTDQAGTCASANLLVNMLPNVIPTAHVISSAGCEAGPDHLHFTADGYFELGKRYAETMLTLLK